jgi:hypothetical protein
LIVNENVTGLEITPLVSVAVTENVEVPKDVGVPEITPAAERPRPAGGWPDVPAAIPQEYG